MDGLGAEAGQARRVQPVPAAAATSGAFSRDRGRHRSRSAACATSSRSTPTPCCRPTRRRSWSARWPTRSTAPCTTPSAGRVVRGLRHPPAAGRRLAAERAPLALRRDPLRPSRRGSVHHRGLRRVPGPLRRGQLHRQGHLRRRRVRARDARALPREHAAVARPDRGQLRPRRARHRHRWSTTTTRPATSPTPGASTAGSAATGSSSAGSRRRVPGPDGPEPQPALAALALEDPRQPAAQHGRAGPAASSWSPAGRCFPARRSAGRCSASARSPRRWIVSLLLALLRPPLDKSWRAYYAAVGARRGDQRPAVGAGDRVPAAPGLGLGRRDRAHALAAVGVPAPPARVADRVADRARDVAARRARVWRTMWPAVRAAAGAARRAACAGAVATAGVRAWSLGAACCRSSLLWIASPADRLRAQRARRAPRAPARRRRAGRRRCATRCSTGASSTASSPRRPTGSRRTTSRRIPSRSWRCAPRRPTSASSCWRRSAPTTSASSPLEDMARAARAGLRIARADAALPRATSTTGTTCTISGCWSRPTSRRWTAATSPATSSRCARPAWAARRSRCSTGAPGGRSDAALLAGARARRAGTRSRRARSRLRAARGAGVTARAEHRRSAPGWLGVGRRARRRWSGASTRRRREPAPRRVDRGAGPTARSRARRSLESRLASDRSGELASDPVGRWRELAARPPRGGRAPRAAGGARRAGASATRMEMDFGFLFDEQREAVRHRLPARHATRWIRSYYDLLASEARLASFVAIAKNDVPVDHWFRLGRTLTRAAGETALVSWSGSMFEYLMPMLVMRSFPYAARRRPTEGAVRRQIAYGAERGVPWGVSESAYNVRDRHHTYQYRAFGVPDLALKRGLGRDLVIAPYASALAAMVEPAAGARQPRARWSSMGALGPYGFRDALDYTRPDPGSAFALVRDLHGAPRRHEPRRADQRAQRPASGSAGSTPTRWCARRSCCCTSGSRAGWLQEPQAAPRRRGAPRARARAAGRCASWTRPTRRSRTSRCWATCPYTVMVSHCGAGYSRYEELAVTRWRADGTRDSHRPVLLREGPRRAAASGPPRTSRSARRPTGTSASSPPTASPSTAPTATIETRTEIAVVPDDAAEVRRVTVTNNGDDAARDRAHQLRRDRARAARRRPRPSGVREPLRRDRVARLVYRRSPPRAARARPRSSRSGACTWWRRARSAWGR